MSNVINCGCGFRPFNFRPTPQSAIDCFFMMRVNQVFSGSFESVAAAFTLGAIVSPMDVTPAPPYTFVSANSASDMSVVTGIEKLPDVAGSSLNHYQIDVAVPTDLVFTDSNGVTFYANGTVPLRIEVATPLTYEQIGESGMAIAVAAFQAITGAYTSPTSFSLVICGNIDVVFVCPALLRLRHEGECNFMPPIGETVTVVSEEMTANTLTRRIR